MEGGRCLSDVLACLTLWDPMDCSPPGSSVHRILQARTLEWVSIPSAEDLPNPGMKPWSPASPELTGGFFTTSATWEACHLGTRGFIRSDSFLGPK